ncbi:hypothetical protein ZWY2020_020675 [Hordeum vulgare]|nr:hypothetical protein ZWY2020_020675 [Hordeum vulgare]
MDSRWAATRRLHAKVGQPPPALHPFPADLPPSAEAVLPFVSLRHATHPALVHRARRDRRAVTRIQSSCTLYSVDPLSVEG